MSMKEMEEIIDELRTLQQAFMDMARRHTGPEPNGVAYGAFLNAETCRMAAEELQRSVPAEAELEGDPAGYWHVCPDCHGYLSEGEPWCRHCGKKILWTQLNIGKEAKKDGKREDGGP